MAMGATMGAGQRGAGSTGVREDGPARAHPADRPWTSASTVLLVSCVAAAVIVLCSVASVALRAWSLLARPGRPRVHAHAAT
jgi:hypothetical protein